MPSIRRFVVDHRLDLIAIAFLMLAVFLLFKPILAHMMWGRGFDYPTHLDRVKVYREGGPLVVPHPLFHLMVLAVVPAVEPERFLQPYKHAGLFVGLVLYMFTAIVTYSLYIRPALGQQATVRRVTFAFVVVVLLMLLAPVNIISWREGHIYWGYYLPNVHLNPTLTTLKPFALLMFVYIVGSFSSRRHFQTWWAVILAITVTVLATLAKPNYTLIMLPVIMLMAAYRWYRGELVNWRLLIIGLIIPSVLLMAAQYVGLDNSSFSGGDMVLRPFAVLEAHGIKDFFLRFLMSIVFPAAVYLLYWRRAIRDLPLNLAWMIFFVGLAVSYLFVQADKVADGNFVWGAHVALTILFATTFLFFLRENRSGFTRASLICGIALALHGLGGLFWYYAEMMSPGFVWY